METLILLTNRALTNNYPLRLLAFLKISNKFQFYHKVLRATASDLDLENYSVQGQILCIYTLLLKYFLSTRAFKLLTDSPQLLEVGGNDPTISLALEPF